MENIRRHYYWFLAVFMFALCALCIAISFWAISSAESIHVAQTYNQIYAIKKANLKDTVQNMIRDIDRSRLQNRQRAEDLLEHLVDELEMVYLLNPLRFKELAMELISRPEYSERLEIVFLKSSEPRDDSADVSFGSHRLRITVNESWVDSQTKQDAADIIHSQRFEYEGYIWVNEIINWDGGDNYAIRRIHPNLIDTEGSFLSTKTQDVKGNTPYLTELEGIKESGELYSTYFFKRKGSSEIAEKLTYAALYKDFSWIIAMGVHIEDVQQYIDAARIASESLDRRIIVFVVLLMLLFFLSALYVLVRLEKWFMHRTNLAIRRESNTDPLTGALNRRMGDIYLYESFRRFQRGIDNPALFSIDLDNFKKVNDTYGHDAGDLVLKSVVNEVQATMRATDHLFRWGGEEFLLVLNGVTYEGAAALAEKLNRSVAGLTINTGGTELPGVTIQISISIGITWFNQADLSPATAIKRADTALYQAKHDGKNCARFA